MYIMRRAFFQHFPREYCLDLDEIHGHRSGNNIYEFVKFGAA